MLIFLLVGIFLALMSGYQLYTYLQTNEFVSEFPGDWDKPLGITVGLYLIIRSLMFVRESRSLFIKISDNQLVFRTKDTDSIRKINMSDIKKIQEKSDKMILVTKDSAEFTVVDFNEVRVRDDVRASIKKALIGLN